MSATSRRSGRTSRSGSRWQEALYSFLYAHEACPALAPPRRFLHRAKLLGREVRAADLTHLASPHQFVESTERVLDRHVWVGPMELVEVDTVGPEAAQAVLGSL